MSQKIQIQAKTRDEMGSHLLAAWDDLERRSAEHNVYLSSCMVMPMLDFMAPSTPTLFLLASTPGPCSELVGLGVFQVIPASVRLPLPHLRALSNEFTYLSGLLVDEACVSEVVPAFFRWFEEHRHEFSGVEFLRRSRGSVLGDEIERVADEMSMRWFGYQQLQRACLKPGADITEKIDRHWSKNQRKNHRRNLRALAEHGDVSYDVIWPGPEFRDPIDVFLRLEAAGPRRFDIGRRLVRRANLARSPTYMLRRIHHKSGLYRCRWCRRRCSKGALLRARACLIGRRLFPAA